ncbi:hypothetical protein JYU34_003070 [Plutella xylostella]|uniref:SHSP domain-containing protein n=1 Tax=Plutella xylostella TaxID=51655 RepID=A0ABQ7QZ36_PLUXY|nr:hypothetical protein JYU34_003070 [Plutella xylostella]
MSLKYTAILALGLLAAASCEDVKLRRRQGDKGGAEQHPLAAIEQQLTQTLAHHYLWPWRQLFEAAAALDDDSWDEPQVVSDDNKFEVSLNVKRFKPDELRVRVKNRHMLVEGKQKLTADTHKFALNHFVQNFVLPAGTVPDEVTAVLKENGVLTVSAPKHKVPPPPPEREVPIVVLLPETTTAKEVVTASTEKKEEVTEAADSSSTAAPLEQLELESTTHVGKIRKKELKTSVKTTKDNEVSKGIRDGNELDYALIEPDTE